MRGASDDETLDERIESFLRGKGDALCVGDVGLPDIRLTLESAGNADPECTPRVDDDGAVNFNASEPLVMCGKDRQANLAEMATLALQLEAMRAAVGDEAQRRRDVSSSQSQEQTETEEQSMQRFQASPRSNAAEVEEASVRRASALRGVQPASRGRWNLQRAIFRALDADGDGRLGCAELLRFAQLTGFDGSEADWGGEFRDLCAAHADGDPAGPTLPGFRLMLDDTSDDGFHCTDKELAKVCSQLASGLGADANSACPLGSADPTVNPGVTHVALPSDQGGERAWGDTEEETEEGPRSSGAKTTIDLEVAPQHIRRDEVEPVDAEELLRKAWEEREAAGEKLGEESEGEGELKDGSGAVSGAPQGIAVVCHPTEPSRTFDSSCVWHSAADDSRLLDDLLVEAGVPHLAERTGRCRHTGCKASREETQSGHSRPAQHHHPAKLARRGALRGPAATPKADAAVDVDVSSILRSELLQLGTKEAMRDQKRIPQLAKRIMVAHLPLVGVAKALQTMASTFNREDVVRPHKLAIAYVFHEMLLCLGPTSDFATQGGQHFLAHIGQPISRMPLDKLAPFLKLLTMWRCAYTDHFLRELREAWMRRGT
mmetsp:Transcript_92315/g.214502  ORF Transcript_92315/g.214502 Transcript_92315/m.214502 type:complete len:603 (-) Transcript_92315:46-1854(-)